MTESGELTNYSNAVGLEKEIAMATLKEASFAGAGDTVLKIKPSSNAYERDWMKAKVGVLFQSRAPARKTRRFKDPRQGLKMLNHGVCFNRPGDQAHPARRP